MHKVSCQIILIQYKGVSACYFHVSETFIIESCHKFILSLSTQNEDVRLKRIGVVYRAVIHINIWRCLLYTSSRAERGYSDARGPKKKDDWQEFFKDKEPDFSEEGWARRKPKKK